jgi:N-acetylmuramoyl-L-alanine amidase CwlA
MTVPIKQDFLPQGREYGRPGYLMTPTSITIHNTANPEATAENHASYLRQGHRISWHFTVDDDSIVQHMPINEQAWHTGTNAGNTTSIGIEVCEFADPKRQAKAEDNAAWLAAKLQHENKSVKEVRTHHSWSGKNCPRKILPHWSSFLAKVRAHRSDFITKAKVEAKVDKGLYEVTDAVSFVNLRSKPFGKVRKVLKRGNRVRLLGKKGAWYKVRSGLKTGWMTASHNGKNTLKKVK